MTGRLKSGTRVLPAPLRFLRALLGRDRPAYIHYAVTTKCNLQCRMCEIWKREAKDELGLDQIEELAAVLAEVGCVQVSLGGGRAGPSGGPAGDR